MKEGIGLPFLLYSAFFSYMFCAAACLLRLSAQLICCKRRTQIRRATRKQLQFSFSFFLVLPGNFFSWIRINSHPATRCSAQHWQWEGEQRERQETVGGQLTSLILANCERCSLLSVWHHRQLPLTRNDTNSESENETEMCKWAQRAYLKQHSEEGGAKRGEYWYLVEQVQFASTQFYFYCLSLQFYAYRCCCSCCCCAIFGSHKRRWQQELHLPPPPHLLTVIRCLPLPVLFFRLIGKLYTDK